MSTTRASDRVTAQSDERVLVETVLALDEHGSSEKVVHDPNAARGGLNRIPEGFSVMTNTSVTPRRPGSPTRAPTP